MALSATVHHVEIDLSDVDRGVYEKLDLRVARHPSESMRYMLTRTVAYALSYEEGIAFSKGLSTTDEPAVWIKDLQGTITTWIEVGNPSAERLHKASKATARVKVFTHAPELLVRETRDKAIHKKDRIEVYALDPAMLDALEPLIDRTSRWTLVHTLGDGVAAAVERFIDRTSRWTLVHTDGQIYVTIGEKTLEGAVTRHALDAGRVVGSALPCSDHANDTSPAFAGTRTTGRGLPATRTSRRTRTAPAWGSATRSGCSTSNGSSTGGSTAFSSP